ncbi:hypothetical protein ACJX0J_022855 [Zea mays]
MTSMPHVPLPSIAIWHEEDIHNISTTATRYAVGLRVYRRRRHAGQGMGPLTISKVRYYCLAICCAYYNLSNQTIVDKMIEDMLQIKNNTVNLIEEDNKMNKMTSERGLRTAISSQTNNAQSGTLDRRNNL